MEKMYGSSIRVYLLFGLLLVVGALCYFQIPVALFPNSTKPDIGIQVPYGKMTRETFLNTYGKSIEAELKSLQKKDCSTEETQARYYSNQVSYSVKFHWGDDGDACIKEVNQILANYRSRWPEDVQKATNIYSNSQGTGFIFITFHSETHSAEQVYEILEPILVPKLTAIHEASTPSLENPNQTQFTIQLSPHKMASFKLLPGAIFAKIRERLQPFSAGFLDQGSNSISIEMSSDIKTIEDLSKIIVAIEPKKNVYLSEIAEIKIEPSSQNRMILKTNGATAVALFIKAAPGKNIKTMSEKVIAAVNETMNSPNFPKEIKFSTIVNPGEFIDHAVNNVMQEVWLCSLIAVIILFIFIGSFIGTLTALIEIPTSIVLSFIIMKLTNVQLNLVSLGGLALSVGMNIDASIVVIDSIIRKFANKKSHSLSKENIVKQVTDAVKEVASPVIVSTITSLIVFIPLIFTSDLTYAILGDLAKTVVYSHGLSLFIAMILVPTIRIHLAQVTGSFAEKHSIAWLENFLNRLYDGYCASLDFFLRKKHLKRFSYIFILVATVLVSVSVPSHLKREIIAKPESPIIFTVISANSNAYLSQMEEMVAKFERKVGEKFGKDIQVTFSGTYSPNNAWMGILLQDKQKFPDVLKNLQEMTKDDTEARYYYQPYNPAELPIPNPPDWKIAFMGNDVIDAQAVKDAFRRSLLEANIVQDLQEDDRRIFDNRLLIQLHEEKLDPLSTGTSSVRPSDLAELVSLASTPIQLGDLSVNQKIKPIFAKYQDQFVRSIEEIAALPIPIGEKIVPLRALADFKSSKEAQELQRINGENIFNLEGFFLENEKANENIIAKKIKEFTHNFRNTELNEISKRVSVEHVDAKVELSKALKELYLTIAISISLIFLVLLIQFSSFVHSLIILLAIPFGILGVFVSLYVFNSTLSLNSGLGMILLVGITVANSIMLVEMIIRLVEEGVSIQEAIMETARKRIRPIVMTSLTTILGMLPVAIGYGDGGKVLQPLGIAVCGGLWVSLIFTLFIVPALELAYLNFLQKKTIGKDLERYL